jgi:transcriptional regulator of nitric oxide reductase
MRTAVLATASLVLRPRLRRGGPGAAATAAAVPVGDADTFQIRTLEQLVADGAVVRKRVTSGEVKDALAKENAADAKLDWPLGHDDEVYIEFVTALVTPEAIGGNLLGVVKLEEYKNDLPKGAQAIYVASSGPYDFIGPNFSKDHRFDRFRLVQGGKTFRLRKAITAMRCRRAGCSLPACSCCAPIPVSTGPSRGGWNCWSRARAQNR